MEKTRKQTQSDEPKISSDYLRELRRSDMGFDEQRKLVEAAIGEALTEAFEQNAEFVTKDVDGRDVLNLRVPHHDEDAPVTVSCQTDAQGNRNARLTFGAGWENNWTYEDGPDQEGRLTPCTRDPETREFIPKPPREPGATYDPTSDAEVSFWGAPWVDNLRFGKPEMPKTPSRLRAFGESILRRTKR